MIYRVLFLLAIACLVSLAHPKRRAEAHERKADHVHFDAAAVSKVLDVLERIWPTSKSTPMPKAAPPAELVKYVAHAGNWSSLSSLEQLAKELRRSGFAHKGEDDLDVAVRFEDTLIVILNAYESASQEVRTGVVEAVYKQLKNKNLSESSRAKLHHTLALSSVSKKQRALVTPHKARIAKLVLRARSGR